MTWLTLYNAGADEAAAASRSIRLSAYVPVFCTLKTVPRHRGVPVWGGAGHGNFQIRCNTPYHMHMEGHWEPARWPGFFPMQHKHAQNDLGVEVRLVGAERTLDGRCDLNRGPAGGCRAFDDDEGASPPRLAQAQVTVDVPWPAGARRAEARISAATGAPFAVAAPLYSDDVHSDDVRWSGRMSLGALPRIASAGALAYVPRYLSDAANDEASIPREIFARANDDAGARAGEDANEHITVYLTLTGRY